MTMKLTKKTIEVTTYNIAVSNEERRTLMDALAIAIDYDQGTVNSSLYQELFNGLKAVNGREQ